MTDIEDSTLLPAREGSRLVAFALMAFGAVGVVAIVLLLHDRAAAASVAPAKVLSSGYTMCASATGAVTYLSSGSCAAGKTTLVVGEQADVATLNSEVSTLTAQVSSLSTQVTSLSTTVTSLQNRLVGVTRAKINGKMTLRISGENVQVVNGAGSEATANGLGNLIIGYNETPGTQSGSHNLALGNGQSYTSYGGLLGGEFNTSSSPYTSVTGGWYNVAADANSSIAGGCDNMTGAGPAPTGPCSVGAESILGGASNVTTGTESSISGGQANVAGGAISSIAGGYSNTSSGLGATVAGGYSNFSGANESSIAGGGQNLATGDVASIAGGYFNRATADEATVLGGCSNLAGPGVLTVNAGCTAFGDSFMGVVGGIGNQTVTLGSTIAGGTNNLVSAGQTVSIAGGHSETSNSASFLTRVGGTGFNP